EYPASTSFTPLTCWKTPSTPQKHPPASTAVSSPLPAVLVSTTAAGTERCATHQTLELVHVDPHLFKHRHAGQSASQPNSCNNEARSAWDHLQRRALDGRHSACRKWPFASSATNCRLSPRRSSC